VRPWQFRKPKTPGFGISTSYYLSVLATRATLPSIRELIDPKGAGGTVTGFGAPLDRNADKSALYLPMNRGGYVFASSDRKTVLKTIVLSKEEANFDPEPYARRAIEQTGQIPTEVDHERITRIRATWSLIQFTFESHDPMVYPALDFLSDLLTHAATACDGVGADSICRRYRMPTEVRETVRLDPRIDAREHVSVNIAETPSGAVAYTLGLQKFLIPEFEIVGLHPDAFDSTARFLLALAQTALLGDLPKAGRAYGSSRLPFVAQPGGFDHGRWGGIPVLELLSGAQTTPTEAITAWDRESGILD
jgi:hypothetical protein